MENPAGQMAQAFQHINQIKKKGMEEKLVKYKRHKGNRAILSRNSHLSEYTIKKYYIKGYHRSQDMITSERMEGVDRPEAHGDHSGWQSSIS